MLHREHQPAAVVRRQHRDERLRAIALAEELDIGGDVAAPGMAADARAGLSRAEAVVEPAAVGGERDAAVESGREDLGQVLARSNVADAQLHFVLAAVANGVDEVTPLAVHGHQLDAGGAGDAQRTRIDDQVVAAAGGDRHAPAWLGHRPAVDGGDLLARATQREVLGVAAAPGRADVGAIHQLGQALLERSAQLVTRQDPLGVGGLGLEPAPRVGRCLILQPAVRVDERLAVNRVHDRRNPRVRGPFQRGPLSVARGQRADGREQPGQTRPRGTEGGHGAHSIADPADAAGPSC